MNKPGQIIKKIIFKFLSFKQYLRLLSRFFFFFYNTGLLKYKDSFKYHYFLKKLINKGDVIIDIGANLGYFSKLFSIQTGDEGWVYAVEPIKEMRDVFKKNVKKRKNITIIPYALGNENKKIRMGNDTRKSSGYIASGSHFVLDADSEAFDEFNAEMKKGSELFIDLEKIDLIKIDIEGFETVVIPEILNLINSFKPILFVETKGENRKKILSLLAENHFEGYVLNESILNPAKENGSADIIFIHKDKKQLITKYLD